MLTDKNGRSLEVGSKVRLMEVPKALVKGLLLSDQQAIRDAVQREVFEVIGSDEYGNVELEMKLSRGIARWIWVSPDCVQRD